MSDKKVKIVRHSNNVLTMFVEPLAHSGEQIAAMLNEGAAFVNNGQILATAEGPEGFPVYGKIVDEGVAHSQGKFFVEQPYDASQQLSQEDIDRHNAGWLGGRAEEYLRDKQPELAASLLRAARKLFKHLGGFDSVDGIRHLTLEAALLELQGKKKRAHPQLRQAYRIAVRLLDESDPFLAASYGNYGEVLLEVGNARKAEPVLAKAVQLIEACQPDRLWSQAILDEYKAAMRELLQQARSALPQNE